MQVDKELQSVIKPTFSFCEHKKNQNSGKEAHVTKGSYPKHVMKNNIQVENPQAEDNKTFLSVISDMFLLFDIKESKD